jgi:transcriptional regulator with XRE-family HTH domain
MAALTEFGKAVRKARIDAEVSLSEMADTLDTTAGFLSALETGRKKIPDQWVQKIGRYLDELGVGVPNLRQLADVANQNVSLEDMTPSRQMLVAGFARKNWDDIEGDKMKELERFRKIFQL